MKNKYILGFVLAALFVGIAIYSFDKGKIEYSDFKTAQANGKTVQVIGYPQKDLPMNYDGSKNLFTFTVKDEKQNISKVVYNGSKPNNFDMAPMVVVKGKFADGNFVADEVLTKCPSKYEGKMGKNQ